MILAVAVGSAARGDWDCTSDRDAVLIGDGAVELAHESERLGGLGWSVASYSIKKFDFQASRGSLFIKHAVDEGKLLYGSAYEWQRMKGRWIARKNYDEEIEDNVEFLRLLRHVPSTHAGYVAAVDVIACSVRNILVRRLAAEGIYSFSWADIARNGHRVARVNGGAWQALSWARKIKNISRAGGVAPVNYAKIVELATGFRRVLGGADVRIKSSRVQLERTIGTFKDLSYGRLRGYELLSASDLNDQAFARLRSLTSSPSYFCSGRMSVDFPCS